MLELIEDQAGIAKAQAILKTMLSSGLSVVRSQRITHPGPGGGIANARIQTNGKSWFRTAPLRGYGRQRYLNWFGQYQERRALEIDVEINVAFIGPPGRIAGMFAKDSSTGATYLLHTGRAAGGYPGVGKLAFLAWSRRPIIAVRSSVGDIYATVVTPIGKGGVSTLMRYVDEMHAFKRAVRDGETSTSAFKKSVDDYGEYYSESSGRRVALRKRRIEYLSRHGEVVDSLHTWKKASLSRGEKLGKNVLLDLGVWSGNSLTEVYEVKTSCERQEIYCAIGQLFVHGKGKDCLKVIVLPASENLPNGLSDDLKRLGVHLMRFTMSATAVEIV